MHFENRRKFEVDSILPPFSEKRDCRLTGDTLGCWYFPDREGDSVMWISSVGNLQRKRMLQKKLTVQEEI